MGLWISDSEIISDQMMSHPTESLLTNNKTDIGKEVEKGRVEMEEGFGVLQTGQGTPGSVSKGKQRFSTEPWEECGTAATTLKPRGDILPPLLRTLDSRDYILDDIVGHK